MRFAFRSHTGERPKNEDAGRILDLDERHLLVVVADGMGGHAGGEVASALAVDTLVREVTARWPVPSSEWPALLVEAVRAANRAVYTASRIDPAVAGMGTTLDAVLIGREAGLVAHVGDGRAYLYRSGVLVRLTDDHSYVGELLRRGEISEAEAEVHPRRNVILRAVGTEAEVAVDLVPFDWRPGDGLLVCTDGLSKALPEAEIAAVFAGEAIRDVERLADRLLETALRRDASDNITVAVVAGAPADGSPAGGGMRR
ncbi:Stp1/IreP family PP2C-type Ser/Thr phosphatase [Hydrogenibacillus schlegelii]|uniref:Protein serine/threonine phosphatase PrpC, regulation of stationary phase n=1 Tax=Hydrogenibacillus schlegelii TaxID=1484 RepID=A0A132MQA2_HYDSH|nr:Stp1/IreP family PP2C-type Ser/Thr phosphatase [Hydrogenibacillus schlegelii]KWX00013.1 hypothetical protein TR75_09060 [Hydrogenibacillus schlegelii]MBT9283595.1 Stp1/IreP family PP2C-type Ser/Thr phosphatase [Hydrogenibacillus schlegelii]OAR05094.1 hypothetical protein SA87_06235 [Hydrogenibacillus schlegelii]PTQ52941.1 MAG: Protein serine/threonine phosphatase PrpC, regulation of stationary phase [Hydrogenibacillus schlegelii]